MTSYMLIWLNSSPNSQETAEMLFQHLCTLIDDPKIDHKSKAFKLAEQLIVDGKYMSIVFDRTVLYMCIEYHM